MKKNNRQEEIENSALQFGAMLAMKFISMEYVEYALGMFKAHDKDLKHALYKTHGYIMTDSELDYMADIAKKQFEDLYRVKVKLDKLNRGQ